MWFYSKGEATYFNANITNTDSLKSFKYKTKLSGNTETDNANGILENVTIAVPLNNLNTFWRSLKMPLINCKVNLKLNWKKYCVLSAAGTDNINNTNSNNINFTMKDTKLYVPVVILSVRDNQKLLKLLSKGFKR